MVDVIWNLKDKKFLNLDQKNQKNFFIKNNAKVYAVEIWIMNGKKELIVISLI